MDIYFQNLTQNLNAVKRQTLVTGIQIAATMALHICKMEVDPYSIRDYVTSHSDFYATIIHSIELGLSVL
jgi:hypothetical protein